MGVTSTVVYDWRERGLGPPYVYAKGRSRTRFLYELDALQRWLEEDPSDQALLCRIKARLRRGELITQQQLAKRFGTTRHVLRRWMLDAIGPPCRRYLGGPIYYDLVELERWERTSNDKAAQHVKLIAQLRGEDGALSAQARGQLSRVSAPLVSKV